MYYYVDLKTKGKRVFKIFNRSLLYQISTCGTYNITVKGSQMSEMGVNEVIEKNQIEYNKMVKEC